MKNIIATIDQTIINTLRKVNLPLARIAIFVVYFWFGILKIVGTSPANPLVESLLKRTLPFITFNQFIIFLGVLEMIIGIIFLIPHLERLALILLVPHMVTTVMPLILLPSITWSGFLTPTLEGQYIIKNILIIALAVSIAAQIKPLEKKYDHTQPRTSA
jgi:uncharacterized membrane protein YkgB